MPACACLCRSHGRQAEVTADRFSVNPEPLKKMPIHLKLLRGPLNEQQLKEIRDTYGKANPRFRSAEFCDELFNNNPYGFSFHAFAYDDNEVVGVYSVVPVRISSRNQKLLSGKGEALYMKRGHRSIQFHNKYGWIASSIYMVNQLHEYALDNGAAVIHGTASPKLLEAVPKAQNLTPKADHYHFLLNPSQVLRFLKVKGIKALCLRGVSAIQRVLLCGIGLLCRLCKAPPVDPAPPHLYDRHLSAVERAYSDAQNYWSISKDGETLRWFLNLGLLDILVSRASPDHFVVAKKGRIWEILHWNVPPRHWRDSLALIHELLTRGIQENGWILSIGREAMANGTLAFCFGIKALGFFRLKIETPTLVHSRDDFFLQEKNIAFSRLFHLT